MENVFLTSLTVPEVRQLFRDELADFLAELPTTPAPTSTPSQPRYLSVKEASKITGLAEQTIYQHRDTLPCTKRHGRLFFLEADLIAYMEKGRKEGER